MAQSLFTGTAAAQTGSRLSTSRHSTTSNHSIYDEDPDEDTIRYNQRLKDRRDRLLEELTRLETENQQHCNRVNQLLKPMDRYPLSCTTLNQQSSSTYTDEEDEYESKIKTNVLDGIEEFAIPQITANMNDEQKKTFLSLLIRYLCLANNYQRNEIKSMYSKQTALYFQAQGLSLDEQREFQDALCQPLPAFVQIEKQNNSQIQQLMAKFPDPHSMADAFHNFVKEVKKIDVNAKDEGSWHQSASSYVPGIDERSAMDYPSSPITSPTTPLSPHYSASSETANSFQRADSAPTKSGHSKSVSFKRSIFRFSKKRSSVNKNNNNNDSNNQHVQSQSLSEGMNRAQRANSNASNSSMGSTATDQTTTTDGNGVLATPSSPIPARYATGTGSEAGGGSSGGSTFGSLDIGKTKTSVSMLGSSRSNAPTVACTSRKSAISGPRLIRFDPDYKQLSSRRQRCDIASVIAAFQNTHTMHTKLKQRLPAFGEDPYSTEQNYGFDRRYSDGKFYTFDTILEDIHVHRQHKMEEEATKTPHPKTSTHGHGLELLLLSPTAVPGMDQGSSRNLRSLINGENDGENKESESRRNSQNSQFSHFPNTASMKMEQKDKEKEKQTKGGRPGWVTLNQFVHLATNFDTHGLTDGQVLVLTHKTFCKSKELLKCLRKRFWMPIPPNLTATEVTSFKTTYVKQIRGKIIAVLRYWLTKHWNDDFRDDLKLQSRMKKFIDEINANEESQSMSIFLAQAFERQQKENPFTSKTMLYALESERSSAMRQTTKRKQKVVGFFYDKNIDVLEFKPEETAACITEINCAALLKIDQRECFEWIKDKAKAPHVGEMIARWNATTNWAQREMLSVRRDFKKRLQCLQYFIHIADILVKLGDFSGAYAINSALTSTPIHRLKRYFAELGKQENQVLTEIKDLYMVSGNYPNLRAKMKNYLSKPCVPHIGLFTRDLTLLAEHASTKSIGDRKYINFGKCKTLAKQIGDLKMYQNNINKFNLRKMYQKPLLDYVETQLEEDLLTDNDMYQLSVTVEPKANASAASNSNV